MKTRFLMTMIGALLAGGMGAAQADVKIFGHIDTSIDALDVDGGSDDINLNCTTCSVGFKGSEDLGNGLKAIFKLDFQYDTINRNTGRASGNKTTPATGPTDPVTSVSDTSSITDRDQWLGLKGNFGQVRIGTISTGYKSHGAMIDPLYRTALQGRDHGLQSSFHSGAGEELQGRATNTIRYDSPDFNGLKAVAHYTLDSNETDEDEDPFGIGASYENGGILVFADYLDNSQSDSDETTAWKLGGKYSMGMFGVMGQYEDFENGSDELNVWHLAGTATMGNSMLYLGFGKGDHDDLANSEYTAWTLAAMHSLSKRTKAYVGFSQVDCDGGAGANLSACRVDGSNVNGEIDQFSLGMKHKF